MKKILPYVFLLAIAFLCTFSTGASAQSTGRAEPDILGKVVDGHYTNDFFALGLDLPKNWVALQTEDSETVRNMTSEALKSGNSSANQVIDKAATASRLLLFYSKGPLGSIENASIAITSVKQPSKFITSKIVLETTKSAYAKNPNTTLTRDFRFETYGGKQFAAADFELQMASARVPVRLLIVMVNGYSLTFSLSTEDAGLWPALESTMSSIKFGGK